MTEHEVGHKGSATDSKPTKLAVPIKPGEFREEDGSVFGPMKGSATEPTPQKEKQ